MIFVIGNYDSFTYIPWRSVWRKDREGYGAGAWKLSPDGKVRIPLLVFAVLAALASFAGESHAQGGARWNSSKTYPDTLYQTYAEGAISFPLGIGLRVPFYDRVNGVSLPWGPRIHVPGGRIVLDPAATYRSNLGKIDVALDAAIAFGRFDSLTVFAGRGTFSNENWIRSALINSFVALGAGSDARNYFRSDRVTAQLSHSFRGEQWKTSAWVAGLHEFDWSTGIHVRHSTAPWSFFGRTDTLKMRRTNPIILRGHITSALAGFNAMYHHDELIGAVALKVEKSTHIPRGLFDDHYTQATIDATTKFPTFGLQTFEFRGHALATSGEAPPQRFSYLGGAGTLSTVDLLALGGQRLLFVEGVYNLPLTRPVLPFAGAPVLSARYAAGAAGIDLPDLIQNIGVGIGVNIVKLEYHIDPNYSRTPYTHKHAFSIGASLSR